MHPAHSQECVGWIATAIHNQLELTKMADSKKARAKKEMSAARKVAMNAVKNASSPQEIMIAKQKLKLVRFQEVGSTRISAFVKAAKAFEATLDTSSYAWTPEQTEKISGIVKARYDAIMSALKSPGAKKAAVEKIQL